jgi:cell division protein FtsL
MTRRMKPANPPSRLVPAILMTVIAGVGFATLMVRLETTREGYRLSGLREEIAKLEDERRSLHLRVAELSSHERLRSLASHYRLAPPHQGQVVMVR